MKEIKSEYRKKMLDMITSLSNDYMRNADILISENIINWEPYKKAETIFTYITMNNEIDTFSLMANAAKSGKKIYAPRCYKDGKMEARRITGIADVELGIMGISEPKLSCPLLSKDQIDLILVPCLSADKQGYRLGYGGGYYDRYLKDYEGISLVLCREKQMSKKIPVEEFDFPTGYYVTENGLFKASI